jgi:hypothetical protein
MMIPASTAMPKKSAKSDALAALQRLALSYPEVETATVCERTGYKARGKAFLFIGGDDESYNCMLKLRDSLAEAEALAKRQPENYAVGGHGWVTLTFPRKKSPPPQLLQRWLDESFRLLAPKGLVAKLPGR